MRRGFVCLIFTFLSGLSVGQTLEQYNQLQALKLQQQSQLMSGRSSVPDQVVMDKERYAKKDRVDSTLSNHRSPEQIDNSVFGRNIFSKANITFAPSLNIPTPANYILAAGDQIFIDVWGETQQSISQKISPDGNITIPGVGLIYLSGSTIQQAEGIIRSRMSTTNESLFMGGTSLKVSLGDIGSIMVNIIGEAAVPGTYQLPSLSTLFNAIYAAGGVSEIGSLREIKLFRKGKEIANLDVYDYILYGKQEVNVRLQDNDLIVVSPYKNLVKIAGKVKRPHTYELKAGQTLTQLFETTGGFVGDAHSGSVNVVRKSGKQQQLYTVSEPQFESFALQDQDSISVAGVSLEFANRVKVSGGVWRPGDYQLSDKMATVLDLIAASGGLKDDAYAGRALIYRIKPDKEREMIALNLKELLSGKYPDVILQREDSLRVFSTKDLYQDKVISIKGEINSGDMVEIPYYEGMTVEDLILVGGGLKESASRARLEVTRRIKDPMADHVSERTAEIFQYTIPENLMLDARAAKFLLEPYDEVYVRVSPGYAIQQHALVNGQVLFPGEYAFSVDGETLTELIRKSGGTTPKAYIKGASLQRKITINDLERIKSLNHLQSSFSDLLKDTMVVNAVRVGDYYSIGIDLEKALKNPGGFDDVTLREDDILTIPTYNNTVRLSGGVYFPTTTTYSPNMRLNTYVSQAGGYVKRARKNKPFVIYMNGKVASGSWLSKPRIEPGCEIVVPVKPPRKGAGVSEVVGVTTSLASLMAILASVIK